MITSTVVIPTLDHPTQLERTLRDWGAGTTLPTRIRVVDSSEDDATKRICRADWQPMVVDYVHSPVKSASIQRNLGAEACQTDLVIFCDDDVRFAPDTLEKFLRTFASDTERTLGGLSGVIAGYLPRRAPSRPLRWYYHLQSGFAHETYGGLFFGAAINVMPTDRSGDPEMVPSQWLNSALVAYRTTAFASVRFPELIGYSFQEDVHLSFQIGRTHRLYFHRNIPFEHTIGTGAYKDDAWFLAVMQLAYRWHNATELLGLAGAARAWKFALAVLFNMIWYVRSRMRGWPLAIVANWFAWWHLAVLGTKPHALVESQRADRNRR